MKKTILISALMLGTLAVAQEYDYELTPVIGYNITEGNIELDNSALVGLEAQYNGLDSIIKPELSVLYTNTNYNYTGASDSANIYRIALNGVYEYEKIGSITPLAKVGVGYETINTHLSENLDSPFLDAGVGAKFPFTDSIALKLEAIYMLKNNNNRWDNNLAILAGLNFAFGAKAQEVVPEPTPEPVVKPIAKPVVVVDGDDDNDGVKNSIDKCSATPAGAVVNADGCPVIVNLHINFDNNSYRVDSASDVNIQKFADFLKMYPQYSAKIVGYTSNTGKDAYNQKLSENRATAVKSILIEKGVDSSKVTASGMGKANPVTDNTTAEGRAQNRRIEAELIKN